MKGFKKENELTKKKSKLTILPHLASLDKSKQNINIATKVTAKPSEEEIINKAVLLHSKGNISEAAKYYQYCIKQGFNNPQVFANFGILLKGIGKFKEAELSIRKAIEINPNFPEAYNNLGNTLKELGKFKEAEITFSQAIKLNSNYANAHNNLGGVLCDLGKLKEAELSTRRAIELEPNYANAYNTLGTILKDLRKLKEAELSFRKAIELNPNNALSYNNLGIILKDIGELKEAELVTRKSINLDPKNALFYNNLGVILKDIKELKEAEISVRKAIELNPNDALYYNNLGTILKQLGRLKESEHNFSHAISLKADLNIAIMNRRELFFEKKEFNLALKDSDKCNTKVSRVNSLEALYALGKVDEIYKRIEESSKIDEKNIYLAAFASFISFVEKKKTANNFCQDPLSFLHFNNLQFHIKDYTSFVREIIEELDAIKTVWAPKDNTTHNGFHTPSYINLFSSSSKRISQLKSIIFKEIDSYYLKFKQEDCTFTKKWPSKNNIFGWHVILKKQGYQDAHIHPSGWLSGVIYLKVVPLLNKNEGAIEFSLNGVNFSNVNSPSIVHKPKLGDIVLFPSSLYHRTIPYTTDTDRIVIAFDLMPEGINIING